MHNETSLHLLCMGPQILTSEGALQPRLSRPYEDERRRAECLQLALAWTGAKLDHGEYETADINAADNKKSTCLHYAAASGMKTCVQVRFRHARCVIQGWAVTSPEADEDEREYQAKGLVRLRPNCFFFLSRKTPHCTGEGQGSLEMVPLKIRKNPRVSL